MAYRFSPPTYRFKNGSDSLFGRRWVDVGQTLLKFGTSYKLYKYVSSEDLTAADVVYLGGHNYIVSDVEAAALTAAGYGAQLSPVDDVIVPDDGYPFPGESFFPSESIFPFGAVPTFVAALYPSLDLYPDLDVNPRD